MWSAVGSNVICKVCCYEQIIINGVKSPDDENMSRERRKSQKCGLRLFIECVKT